MPIVLTHRINKMTNNSDDETFLFSIFPKGNDAGYGISPEEWHFAGSIVYMWR
jgi:hypothetical protein